MLERIELEAGRLNELIGRLLTLARLEDGEQRVAAAPVSLDEVVLNVAEDAEFEAQARHCHVRSEIPAGSWEVRGDASLLHSAIENVVRNAILHTGLRIDGRDTRTVRPIIAEVGVLPRAHGSALFTRGETQAFCVATLGTGQDEQVVDALMGEYRGEWRRYHPEQLPARRRRG